MAEKSMDSDNYIFTLAAIAKELNAGKCYAADIVDCTVMPQCYAAIAKNLPDAFIP